MTYLILDTNAFFEYIGVTDNGAPYSKSKIKNLLEFKIPCITSATLVEAITHFSKKKDINKLKDCLRPVVLEEIKLIGMGFIGIENNDILSIYASEHRDYKEVVKRVELSRRQAESNFAKLILLNLLVHVAIMAIEYYLENASYKDSVGDFIIDEIGAKIDDFNLGDIETGPKEFDRSFNSLFRDIRKSIASSLCDIFKNTLAGNNHIDLLDDVGAYLSSEDISILTRKSCFSGVRKKAKELVEKVYRNELHRNENCSFPDQGPFFPEKLPIIQIKYWEFLVERYLEKSDLIKKNDHFDSVIASSLCMGPSYGFISNDKKILTFLRGCGEITECDDIFYLKQS